MSKRKKFAIRAILIEGDIAYVPLTQGYEAIIDAADVPLVREWNWSAWKFGDLIYACRTDYSGSKQRTVRMHRVIMGEPDGIGIDHRDNNGLNNRRENLREATNEQNARNRRIRSDSTSGLKGVSWRKSEGKWTASIGVSGKRKHLGYFNTPEAAHEAYIKASIQFHGQFGRTA